MKWNTFLLNKACRPILVSYIGGKPLQLIERSGTPNFIYGHPSFELVGLTMPPGDIFCSTEYSNVALHFMITHNEM